MSTYIQNVTDKNQDERELAAFDGGAPVFDDAKTKVVAKGAQTGTEKTMNAGTTIRSNNGVVMPYGDKPGLNVEELQGKA